MTNKAFISQELQKQKEEIVEIVHEWRVGMKLSTHPKSIERDYLMKMTDDIIKKLEDPNQ